MILATGATIISVHKTEQYSPKILANIAALTDTETDYIDPNEICTKVGATANCYRKSDGMWDHLAILSVIEYKRKSIVEICEHAQIRHCRQGTTMK